MSAKDQFHEIVKSALIETGWTITHDPLYLEFDNTSVKIDLAGQQLMAAELGLTKIAVEVKSFLSPSTIYDFHLAVGQSVCYRVALRKQDPERTLYLAVPIFVYQDFFRRPFAQEVIQEAQINLLTFEPGQESVLQWIN
ncbi:element excision factor XisH family protein [Laspinema palackyanum]|uniref:element excision factor XisH family protein n=1 Tax=Laspinema palackyanum TaxID=3231601 RepID=UPI00345D5E7D|nr:fatty-acid oxidation protein subunit alpha [Laspinema sp. D2c]